MPSGSRARRARRVALAGLALALPLLLLRAAALPLHGQEGRPAPGDSAAGLDTTGARGEADRLGPPLAGEPIVVTVTRAEEDAQRVPAAISVVGAEDVQAAQRTLTFDEALARVPGTFAQNRNNFSIGERLSIRGFGARAGFGIRGVKLIVDGIPQTLADGQSVSSNIDLASAGRIEVLRGPSSSLYGNAAGGVVDIQTEAPPEQPTLSSRFTAGKFDLQKYEVQIAGKAERLGYVVSTNRLDYNGFRGHSRVQSSLANARVTFDADEHSRWAVVLNYNDTPVAESPGSLTREQADSLPSQANPRNVATESGESHHQLQAGLGYTRDLGGQRHLSARLYGLDRKVANPLPFAFIDLERFAGGGGLQYVHGAPLLGTDNRLTVGIDVDVQSDDRRNVNNDAGRRGEERLLDQDEGVTAIGVYAQDEVRPHERLELTFGVRYDRVRFDVDDRLPEDGDDSGARTLDDGSVEVFGLGVSPLAGIRYGITPAINAYANIATSFQTPTTTELANRPQGSGGFNPDLEPQKAVSYELGLKGLLGERVTFDLAGFLIDVRDELIPFEVPDQPQRQFFQNAGSSRHNGFEASLDAHLAGALHGLVAYTYSNFFFDEFSTGDADFGGNDIPGVPPHRAFAQLAWRDPGSVFATAEAEYVDEYFVDDANSTRNDSYVLVRLRGGITREFAGLEIQPFAGIDNLFDEEYSGSVVVNAVGSRFFEPSPGRSAYGGISVAYAF
ncbi:MAG: TonB-dependent receptor [Gemmatimonadetes bacterium]|nr:TonB-dependent receptor [Gemmatimonadota bacterium]